MTKEAEQRDKTGLFKIRLSVGTKKLLAGSSTVDQWESVMRGWEETWREVRLAGWTGQRHVIRSRRQLRRELLVAKRKGEGRSAAQTELEKGWATEGAR